MNTLGSNLKRLREATLINGKPMTQDQLGTVTGLPQTAISKYEKGKSVPNVRALLKLAAGLRVPLETLVEGLDVRFDVVYQGLRATVTVQDGEVIDDATETGHGDPPELAQIVPDLPTSSWTDGGREPTEADLAAARSALRRAASDIISATRLLVPRSLSMAHREGPDVRPGNLRTRVGKNARHQAKRTRSQASKRR